jgi:hypothetical protein
VGADQIRRLWSQAAVEGGTNRGAAAGIGGARRLMREPSAEFAAIVEADRALDPGFAAGSVGWVGCGRGRRAGDAKAPEGLASRALGIWLRGLATTDGLNVWSLPLSG